MVVMTPQASEAEIAAVVRRLEAVGVHAKVMPGEQTTAIGAIGDPEGVRALALEGMPGVDQVIPISRPYKLASSELSGIPLQKFSAIVISAQPRTQYICPTSDTLAGL